MPHRLIHKSTCYPSDLADNTFVLQVSGNQDKPFEISFKVLENEVSFQKNIAISVEQTKALIDNTQLVYNQVVYDFKPAKIEHSLSQSTYIKLALIDNIDIANHYANDKVVSYFIKQLTQCDSKLYNLDTVKVLLKNKPYSLSHSLFYLLSCSYQGQKFLYTLFNLLNLHYQFSVNELDYLLSESANTPIYAINNYGAIAVLSDSEKNYCDARQLAYFSTNDALGNLLYGKDLSRVTIIGNEANIPRNYSSQLLLLLLSNSDISSLSTRLNVKTMIECGGLNTFNLYSKYYGLEKDIAPLLDTFEGLKNLSNPLDINTTVMLAKSRGVLSREMIDIFSYPEAPNFQGKLTPGQAIAIGDLHANPIKAIFILLAYEIIDLSENCFNHLVKAYIDLFDAQNTLAALLKDGGNSIQQLTRQIAKQLDHAQREQVKSACEVVNQLMLAIKTIISQITPTKLSSKVIFIGDEAGDRGENDLLMLWLFEHLANIGVNYTIMLSNHGMALSDAVQNKKLTSTLIHSEQQRSLNNMRIITACNQALGIKIDNEHWRIDYVTGLYSSAYSQHLRAIDYSLEEGNITLYTHAAIDEEVIQRLAIHFKVSYCSEDLAEFTASLDRINQAFQLQIKDKNFDCGMKPRKNINGTIERHVIEWLTWYRHCDPRFSRKLNRVETLGKPGSQFGVMWIRGHDPKIEILPHCVCLDSLSGKSLIAHHEFLPIFIIDDSQLELKCSLDDKFNASSNSQRHVFLGKNNNNNNIVEIDPLEHLTLSYD